MTNRLLLATFLLLLSTVVRAQKIDSSYQNRIIQGCIESIEKGKKKITNPQAVCRCIGETHSQSAQRDPDRKDAIARLKWAAEFYETIDPKKLQEMTDKNDAYSSYDDQVVDDCIQSANQGPKK